MTFYMLLVFDTFNKVFPLKTQDIHESLTGFLEALTKVHFLISSYVLLEICRQSVRYLSYITMFIVILTNF
jgi:hypothetical protein